MCNDLTSITQIWYCNICIIRKRLRYNLPPADLWRCASRQDHSVVTQRSQPTTRWRRCVVILDKQQPLVQWW